MSEKAEAKAENSNAIQVKVEKTDGPASPKRMKIAELAGDLKKLSRDALLLKFQDQDSYINHLEEKLKQTTNAGELTSLRESEEKLKLQQQESTRRENVLVMRLATKEQEMQELLTQIHDLKQSQNPAGAQLRSTLLDPAVNIVFQRMKTELDETKEKLEQAQNDLSAWKFTPDSVTGKKLMAKCRMLIQENQELGRQLSQGRVAQLEAELALQKKYSEELKTSQDELNEFVIQLDEEVEGMQSTIVTLQQQLKGVKTELVEEKQSSEKHVEQIRILEQNLDLARTQPPSPVDGGKTPTERDSRFQIDDATKAQPGGYEPGHQPMEVACTDVPYEGGDKGIGGVELHCPNQMPANFKVENGENEGVFIEDEKLDSRNAVRGDGNAIFGNGNVFSITDNAAQESSSTHRMRTDTGNANFRTETTRVNVQNEDCEMEDETADRRNGETTNEDNWTERSGARFLVENQRASVDHARITRDGNSSSVGRGGSLNIPLETDQRKTAATSPCPTTFSISQILGEPKRTPSPDIPPGGDAVVTKIPYMGGYAESSEAAFRTEGPNYLNGEGKDGTPPLVT